MRKWLNKYFDFTKSEFNGLLVLAVLIVGVTIAPYAYAQLVKEDNHPEDYLLVKRLILKNEATNGVVTDHTKLAEKTYGSSSAGHAPSRPVHLFRFDPNVISQSDWVRLGLSERQAGAILKYIQKGGRFKEAADLKKMYTINEQKYEELYPYIDIPVELVNSRSSVDRSNPSKNSYPPAIAQPAAREKIGAVAVKKPLLIVEINAADSAGLDEIRGIGPAFAARILKYRTRLGGFSNKSQLLEVFGLDSAKYLEIRDQISVDAGSIKKININTITADNLRNHPYLRYKQINALIQYRKQHGNYSNIADLAKVVLISPETIAQLAPYLTF